MKKYITLLLSAVFLSIQGFGQSNDSVHAKTETMPEPEFDIPAFLSRNIQFPREVMGRSVNGKAMVKFVVTETGEVDSVYIVNPVHPAFAAEAVRVVKLMPKWKPAKNEKGQPVKVFFTLPINFTQSFADYQNTIKPWSGAVYTEVDKMPIPSTDLLTYFGEHAWLPNNILETKPEGEMKVQFIVTQHGQLDSFRMQKFFNPAFDAMVMHLLDNMPKWQPGIKDGQAVNTYQTISATLKNNRIGIKTIPPPISGPVYTYVDQMPEPGYDVTSYISSALLSTSDSSFFGLHGKVVLRFIVTQSGSIDSISVIKSLNPAIDNAIVYTAQSMPKWKPGRKDGVPVNVYYTIPVPIKIAAKEPEKDLNTDSKQ